MRVLQQLHSHILTHPNLPSSSLSYTLSKIVSFAALSPFGDLFYANKILHQGHFSSIFSYNTVIRALLIKDGFSNEPLFIFKNLIRKRAFLKPNTFTFAFVLKACSVLLAFNEGRQVHKHVVQSGFGSNLFVQTSLINCYVKCEEVGLGKKVFDEMPERNVVAWSAMIGGYSRLGRVNEALDMFREMQKAGVMADEVTLASVVSACAMSGALDLGRWVHTYIDKKGVRNDLELCTALVNMYAKCGNVEKAKEIFHAMPVKDAKAWTSMIVGLAIHGLAEEALETFAQMGEAKVEPNHVTLIGVLSACAHSGLVSEGKKYWSSMLESGIEATMEHYGIMVDLFCRANLIEEAYQFIKVMPIIPNPAIWRTLLAACRRHTLVEKGETIAQHLFQLEPLNAENYLLLSSLYASSYDWVKMSSVRRQMKELGIRTVPGCSSIEVAGVVHEFVMGDRSHPDAQEIREFLRKVAQRVSSEGHEPWLATVLHNVGNHEKENVLYEHSERLAIALGLLKIKAPGVIRIVKNLRVCVDCHEVTKIISRLYKREIVVRDRIRFHKFVDGTCSCKDFW
ncbi:hypothetical protein Leryth_018450 [Lithospermum erythrorhizon]|nr:hypothetical protein Leryth_018450 [Lithospermum erythrorhizon]